MWLLSHRRPRPIRRTGLHGAAARIGAAGGLAALSVALAVGPTARASAGPSAGTVGQGQPAPPCQASDHGAFDFWLGDWDVYDPKGDRVGLSSITKALDGCVVWERYRSATGSYTGESYNIYDRGRGRWHQTWVDNSGLLLVLDGGFHDGAMTLEGERRAEDGARVVDRISWRPLDGGRVQQRWETSKDGGRTWTLVFDGEYRPRP